MLGSGLEETLVVGDHDAEVLAETERGGEMQCVEAAQALWFEASGGIAHGLVDRQQRKPGEPGLRLVGVVGSVAGAGTDGFDREEQARDVALPVPELRP